MMPAGEPVTLHDREVQFASYSIQLLVIAQAMTIKFRATFRFVIRNRPLPIISEYNYYDYCCTRALAYCLFTLYT